MKNLFLTFLMSLFLIGANYGQESISYLVNQRIEFPVFTETNTFLKSRTIEHDLEKFDGTKYLEQDFKQGIIANTFSQKKTSLLLRYDALNDLFEIKDKANDEEVHFLDKDATAIEVTYDNIVFVQTSYYDTKNRVKKGYLGALGTLGETKIYAKYDKAIQFPKRAETSYDRATNGKLSTIAYYLTLQEGNLRPIKIDEKSVLAMFHKDQQAKVKDIIIKEKLKLRKPEDVSRLIHFTETL